MDINIRDISKKWFASATPQNFVPATATLGSDTNGTIAITANYSVTTDVVISAALATEKSKPMSVKLEDGKIIITLGTTDDAEPTADNTKNTAKLVAEAISKIEGFVVAYSGNGSTVISVTESDVEFADGQYGTPCPEIGTGLVSGSTYYVNTTANNSVYNTGWKQFTLSDIPFGD